MSAAAPAKPTDRRRRYSEFCPIVRAVSRIRRIGSGAGQNPAAEAHVAVGPYRSTPVFDENTLPAALRSDHNTRDGVWGAIRVLEGQLLYTVLEPHAEHLLTPDNPGLIRPQQKHFVTALWPVRMRIDFYDAPPDLTERRSEDMPAVAISNPAPR